MYYREDVKTAADHLRKTIPLMVERDIPTDPCNFALWYSYAADKDEKLKTELDERFPGKGSYEPEKSEQLFFDYFVKSYLPENRQAQESLAGLLSKLFGSAQAAADGTREYSESLQDNMQKIQDTDDPAELARTLENLLKDTEAADAATQTFHGQLSSAKEEIESLKRQLEDSEKSAFIDSLTQIGNRRFFDKQLGSGLEGQGCCLLLIDLDHFKQFNDTYGHLMGDRVLSAVGQLLDSLSNEKIQVARYGGEEFGIVMPASSIDDARRLGETIRTKMEAIRIKKKDIVIESITTSIGVAQQQPGETGEALIQRADQALYQAKQGGRNQVQCAA